MPKQKFEWRHADACTREDDWQPVEALDAWMAAKAGADQWDEEDRSMTKSDAVHVFEVRDQNGAVTRWAVHGEAQPYYYATPLS